MNPKSLIEPLVSLAIEAGKAILAVYETDFDVEKKADASPLTKADMASNRCIVQKLAGLTPDIPVITEEAGLPEFEVRRKWLRYWLIDPLDGTKEFVSRNGEFTVNIALIENGRPVLGVVHVPVQGKTYVGCAGVGAELRETGKAARRIRVSDRTAKPARVVGSRSHRGSSLDAFLERVGSHEFVEVGSSLKLCLVAEGLADVYPRMGPTSEWDTAAGQCVLEQAGGHVLKLDGEPLEYNRENTLNPNFVGFGDADIDWLAMVR